MISLQGCSDWWIRSSHKHMQREPGVLEWLRAAVFFMPHLERVGQVVGITISFVSITKVDLNRNLKTVK